MKPKDKEIVIKLTRHGIWFAGLIIDMVDNMPIVEPGVACNGDNPECERCNY